MFKYNNLSLVVVNGAVISLKTGNYVILYKDIEDTHHHVEYALFINNEAQSVHPNLVDALDTLDYLESKQ